MPRSLLRHLISTAWSLLCRSAFSVHASLAISIIGMTNACWSFTLVPRGMFLAVLMVFSLAIAVAVCASLARILVFNPSSLMIVPRYLKWSTVSVFFRWQLSWWWLAGHCHKLSLFRARLLLPKTHYMKMNNTNLRILWKIYSQHQQNINHVFIYFKKAFDRVWHYALWATMNKFLMG